MKISKINILYFIGGTFFASLAIRLIWQALFQVVMWSDSSTYLADGDTLFATGHIVSMLTMPLFPIFLHLFGMVGILPVQAVLSALSVVLASAISWRVGGSKVAAIVTAVVMCGYPPLVFYANAVLTETLYIFLLLAAMLAYWHRQWMIGAVFLVLGILTRPTLDLLAPLLIIAFSVMHQETLSWRLIGRRLGGYLLVYLLLMSPWWLHNFTLYGHFVRLNIADGIVIRLENNPTFDRVGLDFSILLPAISAETQGIQDPVQANDILKTAAWDYVKNNPGHYLERCIERLGRFWTPIPGSANPFINLLSFVLAIPIFIGAFAALARSNSAGWRRVLPIVLLVGYMTAVHSATHALFRYRLPLEPFLIILASQWCANMVQSWPRTLRGRRLGGSSDQPPLAVSCERGTES